MGFLDRLKAAFRPAEDLRRRAPLELEAVAGAVTITDGDGKKVVVEDLDREIAAPSRGGVRSIITTNVTAGLDPGKLARILNAAVNGQPEDYYQLAEEMEEKYLQYQAALKARKLAVTQLDVTIEAATDDARHVADADLCRDFVDTGNLELEAYDILDAFGKGFSVTELLWPKGMERLKKPWMPRLTTRPQRDYAFDEVDGETLRLKGGNDNHSALPTDLRPYKFIIHRSAGKTGLTVRGGLARSVAWCYLFQNMSLKDWVLCAQAYGMPIRVGKYDRNATDDDRRKLLNAVMNIAADQAAIIPDTMVVDFVEAMASATPDIYKSLCEYCDQQVSKLVLGQTATTDATSGGLGGSQGKVHDGVRERFQRADARALAATLKRDLFTALIDINHGPPPDGLYPKIKIGQAEEFTKDDLDILEGLVGLGVEVEMSVVRDKAGYPDPPKAMPDGSPVKLLRPRAGASSQPSVTSPEKAPQAGKVAPGAAVVAASGTIGLSEPVKSRESGVAPPANPSGDDALDALTAAMADELVSDWQPIMAPLMDPLRETIAAATSYADLQARLLALPNAQKAAAFAELLARGTFIARLAGEAGLEVTEQQK